MRFNVSSKLPKQNLVYKTCVKILFCLPFPIWFFPHLPSLMPANKTNLLIVAGGVGLTEWLYIYMYMYVSSLVTCKQTNGLPSLCGKSVKLLYFVRKREGINRKLKQKSLFSITTHLVGCTIEANTLLCLF